MPNFFSICVCTLLIVEVHEQKCYKKTIHFLSPLSSLLSTCLIHGHSLSFLLELSNYLSSFFSHYLSPHLSWLILFFNLSNPLQYLTIQSSKLLFIEIGPHSGDWLIFFSSWWWVSNMFGVFSFFTPMVITSEFQKEMWFVIGYWWWWWVVGLRWWWYLGFLFYYYYFVFSGGEFQNLGPVDPLQWICKEWVQELNFNEFDDG